PMIGPPTRPALTPSIVRAGLVGGPIIGGIASDPNIIGSIATVALPFYIALGIVAVTSILVIAFFHDVRKTREPFTFRPLEVFDCLWRIRQFPLVMRLTAVLFFFHIANVTFYVFIDTYMSTRFGYGTLGVSMVMLTIGVAIALTSTFLVVPAQKRFTKTMIVRINLIIWVFGAAAVILIPVGIYVFIAIFVFYAFFGVTYPTILAIFSLSVDDSEQGWVMGITIAVFTLCGGIMSLIGAWLMSINIDLPFYVTIGAALVAMGAMSLLWTSEDVRKITGRV
ncbi:MAG: MFS transporter, partial [Pseudomonadota bacterium]